MNDVDKKLKSKKYYTSIIGLDFHPVEHVSVPEPKFRKGDVVSKRKFLFKKPEIKYAETDLYEDIWYDWEGGRNKSLYDPITYARRNGAHYDKETGEFYRPAKVIIKFEKNEETKSFIFDADALDFIKDLKEKCKKCGNELL